MTTANKLTILRVLMIPAFLVVLYWGFPGSRYVALGIYIVACLTDLLDGYPDVTSSLLHRVEAAGGSGITIQFTDYNASTGELLFNANSSQVIDIPAYIRSLQNCGVFSTVSYTGYKADDDGYSIDLRCVLAAPQQ